MLISFGFSSIFDGILGEMLWLKQANLPTSFDLDLHVPRWKQYVCAHKNINDQHLKGHSQICVLC